MHCLRHCAALVIAIVLLASSPAWPSPPDARGTAPRPAPKVEVVDAKKVAAARERLKKVLEVSPKTLDAAARYLAMADSVKQTPTEAALCSLLVSAGTLHVKLGDELSETRDRLYALPPPAQGEPDQLQAFSDHVDETDKLLPGIGLAVGAETLYHSVRHLELASLAQRGSAEQRLLEALGGIWQEPTGRPIYFQQQSDVTGCWRPGALLEPLRRTFAVWAKAPHCLQQALTPAVQEAMLHAVRSTCFCESKEQTSPQLQQLAATYEKLPVSGAKLAAAEARKVLLQSEELWFNCR